MRLARWLAFVALAGCICACRQKAPSQTAPNPAIASAVQSNSVPAYAGRDRRAQRIWKEERRFYSDRSSRLVWSDGSRLNEDADAVLQAIHQADQDGLDPADYNIAGIEAKRAERLDAARAGDVDLRLTYAYFSLAWDLAHGVESPEQLDPKWHEPADDDDIRATLVRALDEHRVRESLAELAPKAPQYVGLKHQLARCREMAAKGATTADGAPVDQRIRQIAINMDRWRWMPRDLGSRYLIVNIPAYRLDVIENGRSVLDMKVVVGKKDNPTPVLADRMTTVVFSPYWNIPPEIVQKETLPHVLKDPAYLDKNNIEVVRASNTDEPVDVKSIDWDDADVAAKVRFRQKPGAGNSLGFVKFIFPNHFNVYLHDTPAQALFNRIERDFSHGCVRVERPMDLAKYVLRDQASWTEEKIDEAMHSGRERSVALKEPLPVYLVYFTAWEENGTTKFGDDVYGYDRRQAVRN
jgi:murein L,D-transpeptidase YcbB/YkuD